MSDKYAIVTFLLSHAWVYVIGYWHGKDDGYSKCWWEHHGGDQ